jgi:hypothetical protein
MGGGGGAANGTSGGRLVLKGNERPAIDEQTKLAIMTSLAKVVDVAAKKGTFYDPSDGENGARRMNELLERPMCLLRSWMRSHGFKALDTYQRWDGDGSFLISRFELGAGLKQIGLPLSKDLLTLVFDRLASGYHLRYEEWKAWFDSYAGDEGGGGAGATRLLEPGQQRHGRVGLLADGLVEDAFEADGVLHIELQAAVVRIQRRVRGFLGRRRAQRVAGVLGRFGGK